MAAKLPYFPFYPKDWLTDENVMNMTLKEQGAYINMLCYCWIQGSIPDNEEKLSMMLGMDRLDGNTDMAVLWAAIRHCFVCHPKLDGRLINARLEQERDVASAIAKSKSNAGKKGAKARWGNEVTADGRANATALTATIDVPLAKYGKPEPEPEPEPELEENNPPPRKRGSIDKDLMGEFEIFWGAYPRRVARKPALDKWMVLRNKKVPAEDLLAAAKNYAQAQAGTESRSILHAATFLGPQERWREFVDGIPEGEEPASKGPPPDDYDGKDYDSDIPEGLR